MQKERIGYYLIIVFGLIAIAGFFVLSPIEQSEEYHDFCDGELILGIPNFWNVVSNIPFMIVGLLGLLHAIKIAKPNIQYVIFFVGVSLVAIGSGYYHLYPNSQTLIWDRLPMTIAFMSLLSIIISEFMNAKAGLKLLGPLLLIGILSVVYWVLTGDLKFYAIVQFYPIVVILVALTCFRSTYTLSIGYWVLLASYILAKVFEHFDCQTQNMLLIWSGHTLKHLTISIGIIALFYTYIKRTTVNSE
ncbi:MAG: ceramidase domain-containing protein [Cyclobacteriaceae bacterium]